MLFRSKFIQMANTRNKMSLPIILLRVDSFCNGRFQVFMKYTTTPAKAIASKTSFTPLESVGRRNIYENKSKEKKPTCSISSKKNTSLV